MSRSPSHRFDGGAGTFVGTGILAVLVTVLTLGICYPFAVVLFQRWQAKHTYINGHRLRFAGSAWGLFGSWIRWFLLTIITIGIYGFWVYPRMIRWVVEHTEFDPTFTPGPMVVTSGAPSDTAAITSPPPSTTTPGRHAAPSVETDPA